MTPTDKVIEAARAVCSAKHITRSRPDIHGPVDDRIDELLGTLHALDATPDESVVVTSTIVTNDGDPATAQHALIDDDGVSHVWSHGTRLRITKVDP